MELREHVSDIDFFLPAYNDKGKDDQENMYQAIAELNSGCTQRRIYSVTFEYRGKLQTDTVGEEISSNKEVVIAIFRSTEGLYYTITKSRGLRTSDPMLSKPISIVYFRDSSSS